jgi:hypothetical protein
MGLLPNHTVPIGSPGRLRIEQDLAAPLTNDAPSFSYELVRDVLGYTGKLHRKPVGRQTTKKREFRKLPASVARMADVTLHVPVRVSVLWTGILEGFAGAAGRMSTHGLRREQRSSGGDST